MLNLRPVRTLPRFIKWVIASLFVFAISVSNAADQVAVQFDVPAQPLGTALKTFATQAGVQVLFSADMVQDAQSAGIKGEFAPAEALRRLLTGTGLGFRESGGKTFAIIRDASLALPEVVVTATRTERRVEDVPASVSVVTSDDIALQQTAKSEDLLKNVAGVDINASPASGSPGMIMLRGIGGSFAGETSVVLLDGMPTDSMISGVLGRGGLAFVPDQDIERIEVVRGPASALYGPNVVGGVINVIPKRWQGAPGVELLGEIGSHNSRTLGVAAGFANDVMDIRVSGSDFATDGFVAKPVPDPDGEMDLAPRDWTDSKRGFRASTRPAANQEITLDLASYRIDAAIVGGRPNYRQEHEGDTAALGYRYDFGNAAALKFSYRKNKLKQDMRLDDEAWNYNPGSYFLAYTSARTSESDAFNVQSDIHLGTNNVLTFGVFHQLATFKTEKEDVFAPPAVVDESKSKLTGVYIQDEHRFADALTVIAGGRYDRINLYGDTRDGVAIRPDSSDTVFNPRLGLGYRFSPATAMYVSAGTAYVPALNAMKSPGGTWLDNPDLKPESSTSYEVGVNQRLGGRGSLRAAVFHTDYVDKISTIKIGTRFQYQNIGKVEVNGFELETTGQLAQRWRPYANYTYTDSIIKENPRDPLTEGKRTQRVAPNKLNAGLVYAYNDKLEARFGGRYVDERYFTDRNTPDHRAPGYFVADTKIAAKLAISRPERPWEAYVAINNIFDRQYTEWEYEYADGRNIWFGVNGRF